MLLELTAIVTGYLLGSIPTAYIIAKLKKGVDIRDVDVGNMGAGATFRQIGIWEGAVVVVIDAAKGAAAIIVAQALGIPQLWVLVAGFAAILGHSFPIYIGFRGGQGAATIIGIFLVLAPEAMAITLGLIGVILFSRYRLFVYRLFFAVACASPTLPLFVWLFEQSALLTFYSLAVVLFVAFRNRHRLKTPKTLTSVHKDGRPVDIDGK